MKSPYIKTFLFLPSWNSSFLFQTQGRCGIIRLKIYKDSRIYGWVFEIRISVKISAKITTDSSAPWREISLQNLPFLASWTSLFIPFKVISAENLRNRTITAMSTISSTEGPSRHILSWRRRRKFSNFVDLSMLNLRVLQDTKKVTTLYYSFQIHWLDQEKTDDKESS